MPKESMAKDNTRKDEIMNAEGRPGGDRYDHLGEGVYAETESMIRRLLADGE